MLKRKKKKKRNWLYVYVCLSVCLLQGSPLVMPLPWPRTQCRLEIIIIIRLSIPTRPIDLLGILSHLQLEVPIKPNQLLMLRYNGLNLKIDNVMTSLRNAKKKVQRIRIKITHSSCVLRIRITHEIWVTPHRTLPSKPVRTKGVNRPRQERKVNRTTSSQASCTPK